MHLPDIHCTCVTPKHQKYCLFGAISENTSSHWWFMHHEDGFAESDHNLYASPYSSPYQGLVSGIRLFNWRKKKKNMNISELAMILATV